MLLAPLAWWNLKRYQHDHYGIGQVRTRLGLGPGSLYGLSFRVLLVSVGVTFTVFTILFIAFLALTGWRGEDASPMTTRVTSFAIGATAWLAILLLPMSYATSQVQNLVWSNTKADALRFESRLSFGALLGVTAKNWGLMLLTLGLYAPFAAVATYRLRVETVTPRVSGDLSDLHQQAHAAAADASGDAAGDLFGIDIGL